MEASSVPVNDREALKRFFSLLRVLLQVLVEDPHGLFPTRLRPTAETAWEELVAEGKFEALDDAIDSGRYDDAIAEHGLQVAQLAFKMAAFDRALDVMEADSQRRLFRVQRLRESAPEALETADVPLDSMAAFFPSAGAIGEFKKVTQAVIARRARITMRIPLVQAKSNPAESGCFRSYWRTAGAPMAHSSHPGSARSGDERTR
jgi:hypothetical protein